MRALFLLPMLLGISGCGMVVALGLGTERGRAHVVEHTDALADGHEIRFWQRKSASPRATLVLLHGHGGTRDHWTYFAAALPDEVDVIAFDLPGFGDSTKDEALSYDLERQVARVRAFIKQRGLSRYHLFGHSMGGRVAAELALRDPEGIESLVLFNPAGIEPPRHEVSVPRIVVDSPEKFDALMAAVFVVPPKVPGFLKQHFADEMQRNEPFAEKVHADMMRTPSTLADRAGALAMPTLVVWGDTDRIIDPSAAEVWRDKLRAREDNDVVVMKQTGHAPMLERPHESAALVFQWWRRHALVR